MMNLAMLVLNKDDNYPEFNNKIVTVPQENIINPPDADDVTRGSALLVVADINNNNEYIQINGTALTGKFFQLNKHKKYYKLGLQ
jgi:hypothetical protein